MRIASSVASRWVLVVGVLVAGVALASLDRGDRVASSLVCPSRPDGLLAVSNGSFAVWYPDETGMQAKARKVLAELSGPISTRFNFMKPPVSDINTCNDGGTQGIDFYLVHDLTTGFWEPVSGLATRLDTRTDNVQSGFAQVDVDLKGLELNCTVAHEYFHILQYRYGPGALGENKWWVESTATWSEFVYKVSCFSPPALAGEFLNKTFKKNITELSSKSEPYEAWLWALYVQKNVNQRFVRTVFEGIGAAGDDGEAAEEIDDQIWKRVFPEFVLHEFNKGPVDDFDKWRATGASVKTKDVDLSLKGKPFKEVTLPVTVEPGGGFHVLLQVFDVNTRHLEIDVSDFTRKPGAALRVLQQPTMGPSPEIHFNEWDRAVIENWSTARKKTLCRDNEDEDYQQILLAFSNTDWDGSEIDARIKLRSEAICPWNVTVHTLTSGTPPQASDFSSATGSYTRGTYWNLTPLDEPVMCQKARRACLPLVGSMTDSVSWKADGLNSTDDPTPSSGTVHVEAAGRQRYTFAADPGPADLPRPALFQEMKWDAASERFLPILRVMTANYALRNGVFLHRTPATTARVSATGTGECDRINGVPDWTYAMMNNHGAVTKTWTSCLEDSESYGVNAPLYFTAFGLPATAKAALSNEPGDGVCPKLEYFAPWSHVSGGPCWQVTLEPHEQRSTHQIGFTAAWPPVPAEGLRLYTEDYCRQLGVACPVNTDELADQREWPLVITTTVTVSRPRQ